MILKTQFTGEDYAKKLSSTLPSNAIKWVRHIKFSRMRPMKYHFFGFGLVNDHFIFQSPILNVDKLLSSILQTLLHLCAFQELSVISMCSSLFLVIGYMTAYDAPPIDQSQTAVQYTAASSSVAGVQIVSLTDAMRGTNRHTTSCSCGQRMHLL